MYLCVTEEILPTMWVVSIFLTCEWGLTIWRCQDQSEALDCLKFCLTNFWQSQDYGNPHVVIPNPSPKFCQGHKEVMLMGCYVRYPAHFLPGNKYRYFVFRQGGSCLFI